MNPMKFVTFLLATIALSFAVTATAVADQKKKPANPPEEIEPAGTKEKVKPGEAHTNNDGVTVDNDSDSTGNATIDPKDGSGNSQTDVDTQTGFEGDISGIDNNDTVDLGSSNDVNVSGTGGNVSASGGSTVNVSNTGPVGGGNINVTLPSGTTINVGPGSNVTINT
jgi:hypothetical protein